MKQLSKEIEITITSVKVTFKKFRIQSFTELLFYVTRFWFQAFFHGR